MKIPVFIATAVAILALLMLGLNMNSNADKKTELKPAASLTTEDFWTTDWDKGIADARAQKKPVIIDFYTDWCGWCKKLDKDTYAAPEILKRLKEGWIGIKVNPEDKLKSGTLNGQKAAYAQIARFYKVQGYPTLIFLDKEGNQVDLNTPINYVPKEPFGPLLDYIKGEIYKKNVSLEQYIQENMKK